VGYEYDRLEREEGGGSFLMGLLAGTVLGAGLGMLFAPKAGNELRSQLTESAGRLRSSAEGTYGTASEKVHQMMDRGREAYDKARSSVGSAAGDRNLTGTDGLGTTGTTGSLSGAGTGSMTGAGSSTPGGFNPNRNS
jgi:gas vesicle protein